MSKLEELHTLVRLLKEYEFPVSPILEYAIQEKINYISANEANEVILPVIEIPQNVEITDISIEALDLQKKRTTILRIIRADGSIIECKKAVSTFCQAIKEIGAEKVYLLKIPMDGMHLVTIGGNPKYPTAQHDVGNGYFVNVHSNTITKKRQLERIFKVFNLNWQVEIIESY